MFNPFLQEWYEKRFLRMVVNCYEIDVKFIKIDRPSLADIRHHELGVKLLELKGNSF